MTGTAAGALDSAALARLRVLEDKEALRALMVRGWRALDRKDWHTWIDCWSPDAVLAFEPWGVLHGKEAIRAKVTDTESGYPAMQHHILNMHFDVDADRATGIGYMWFVARAGATPAPQAPYAMGGTYEWTFNRTADGWLLDRQDLAVLWTSGTDTRGAFG